MEPAPFRRIDRADHVPFKNYLFPLGFRVGRGHGSKESLGIWVFGCGIEHLALRQFYQLPAIHDPHPVAHESDHRRLWEMKRYVSLASLKLYNHVQDGRLGRDVEERGGLIEDDELGGLWRGHGRWPPAVAAPRSSRGEIVPRNAGSITSSKKLVHFLLHRA